MRAAILGALLLAGCESALNPTPPASQAPGCHYVTCGNLMAIPRKEACGVFVDNRLVSIHTTGQEALDFIRANNLRTCESR